MKSMAMLGLTTALALIFAQVPPSAVRADNPPSVQSSALAGQVSSEAEGNMEGVVVTANKDGSIVQTSVITDAKGHYAFPENRLEPGHYSIAIRAVGYDLSAPAATDVVGEKTANVDLKLVKTKYLPDQMTNAEWMMSIPGTEEQKAMLLNCTSCHTMERIVRSTHNSDEWTQVISRMMGYGAVSQPIKPQPMLDRSRAGTPEQYRKMADYLAIDQSVRGRQLAIPTARPCRVRPAAKPTPSSPNTIWAGETTEPHDILVDKEGNVWYSDFGEMFIGKFNPKTLKLTQYPIKKFKPNAPTGLLSIEFDHLGKIWFDTMYQGSLGCLDPKTGEIKYYPLDAKWNDDRVQLNFTGLHYEVDNKVWTKSVGTQEIFRVDLGTGNWEKFHPTDKLPGVAHAGIYQVMAELQEQSLDGGVHRRPSWQDRRQDRRSDVVRNTDGPFARPPHGDRQPGPRARDRISHQQGRAVRPQDRAVHRIHSAGIHLPLPGEFRQERRDLGFHHVDRPRRAHGSEDRSDPAVSDAVRYQHAHGVHRQHDDAGDVLGRLQSRSSHREGRAAGLSGA